MKDLNHSPTGKPYAVEQLSACPYCGSGQKSAWRSGKDYAGRASDETFFFQRCERCDLRFLNPRLVEKDLPQLYSKSYAPYHNELQSVWLEEKEVPNLPLVVKQLRAYRKKFPTGSTFLDYGFGAPTFLELMKAFGWKTIGMDFSPESVERCRALGHESHLADGLKGLEKLRDGSVQVALLNHVFEHLYHPKEFLRILRAKIAPGGLLHIAVPNPAGVSARLLRSYWIPLEPRHIMLYTPEALRKALKEHGFATEETLFEPVYKDFTRAVGRLLHEKGLTRRAHDSYERSRLVNRVMRPTSKLAARLGLSDRFHVIARKD